MGIEEKPLHVVELIAENVKRLRAVRIRPNGSTVVIGGANAQGKSSCLDAIEMALGGGKTIPQEPIRHGARKARVVADLGEIIVERTFTSKGTELVVRGKDGMPKASPQKLLDSLTAKVTFDPLQFARMDPKQQDELLKKMLGLDFSDIEAARQRVYDKRAEANRDLKRCEVLLETAQHHPDAPKELVNIANLSAELEKRFDSATKRKIASEALERQRGALARHDEEIARLETQLARYKEQRPDIITSIEASERDLPPEPAPASEIQQQLRTAEATNGKVRANAERAKLAVQIEVKAREVDELTGTIASLDEEKATRLAAAKFPIDGLGFDDAGPTFKGVPIAQASQAERLRLSVAIGAAMNPRIKIMLIREGSLLDSDSMTMLAELAEQTGSQIWVERVSDKDPGAIVIEDGAVREEHELAAVGE